MKKKQLSTEISTELFERLDKVCQNLGMKKTALVSHAVAVELDRLERLYLAQFQTGGKQ